MTLYSFFQPKFSNVIKYMYCFDAYLSFSLNTSYAMYFVIKLLKSDYLPMLYKLDMKTIKLCFIQKLYIKSLSKNKIE